MYIILAHKWPDSHDIQMKWRHSEYLGQGLGTAYKTAGSAALLDALQQLQHTSERNASQCFVALRRV